MELVTSAKSKVSYLWKNEHFIKNQCGAHWFSVCMPWGPNWSFTTSLTYSEVYAIYDFTTAVNMKPKDKRRTVVCKNAPEPKGDLGVRQWEIVCGRTEKHCDICDKWAVGLSLTIRLWCTKGSFLILSLLCSFIEVLMREAAVCLWCSAS